LDKKRHQKCAVLGYSRTRVGNNCLTPLLHPKLNTFLRPGLGTTGVRPYRGTSNHLNKEDRLCSDVYSPLISQHWGAVLQTQPQSHTTVQKALLMTPTHQWHGKCQVLIELHSVYMCGERRAEGCSDYAIWLLHFISKRLLPCWFS